MSTSKKRVAVLISGRGYNMASLVSAAAERDYPAEITCVISDRPGAAGLKFAASEDIATIDSDDLQEGALCEILVWDSGGALQSAVVRVGHSRTSDVATFDVTVPKRASDYALSVALILNGRVAQMGVLRGPVTATGSMWTRLRRMSTPPYAATGSLAERTTPVNALRMSSCSRIESTP